MNTNPTTSAAVSDTRRRAWRCRITGVLILLLGLAGAGAVYWLGSRTPDYSDDPSMAGFNRSEERQMAILYGKQGQFIEDLENSLKQPGTQAILIVAAAAVIAAGCFYFARILEEETKQTALTGQAGPDDSAK
jgi:flagellar basal body-associated protein FliL